MPVNYQQAKIYIISNDVDSTIYVGSTAQVRLCSRKTAHNRMSTETEPQRMSPLYVAMRLHGIDHFFITLHHAFPCLNKDELEAEEFKLMREFKEAGQPLYNSRLAKGGYTLPDATREKIRAKLKGVFGKDAYSGAFNYGSMRYAAKKWILEWYEMGKKRTKSFSSSGRGFIPAKLLIEDFRRTIYPEWKSEEELTIQALNDIVWD